MRVPMGTFNEPPTWKYRRVAGAISLVKSLTVSGSSKYCVVNFCVAVKGTTPAKPPVFLRSAYVMVPPLPVRSRPVLKA